MLESTHWKIRGSLDEFKVTLSPYQGLDFSRMAFMFCGQGQMTRGSMADVAGIHPVFTARLKEIDEIAGARGLDCPSRYLLEPNSELTEFEDSLFSTLCLFGLQLSMFEVSIHRGFAPEALTAHSFGEYSLLTAAGVIGFREMVEILILRQKAIETAKPLEAALFVVNGSHRLKPTALSCEFHLANQNTPFQSTFVCRASDFPTIKGELKGLKIPFVTIPLNTPFHTPWMEKARELFAESLLTISIKVLPPKIPYVSSVTRQWTDRETFKAEDTIRSLSEQLTTPVDFPSQIQKLNEKRIQHFFELSPSDVLVNFVEQSHDLSGLAFKVNSFRRHFKTLKSNNKTYDRFKSSKLFTALDTALKSLTGYSIQSIQLEDRIREDLGIDSIKKAEIVFEIIDLVQSGTNLAPTNLADLSSFGDILEYLEESQRQSDLAEVAVGKEQVSNFGPFVFDWTERALVDYQPNKNREILVIEDREDIGDWTPTDALEFIRSFKESPIDVPHVVFLRGLSDRAAAKDAFFISYSQERKFTYKSIRLHPEQNISKEDLALEIEDFRNSQVCLREGRRVRELRAASSGSRQIEARRVLVLGGLGGVGREQVLALPSPETLLLLGRKAADQRLAHLQTLLPETRIEYVQHSIDSAESLALLIEDLDTKIGSFDLIIHSAGVELSADLATASMPEIEQALSAKMIAGRALRNLADRRPELTVLFNSSIVSEFPSRGQSAYALANGYLNALSHGTTNILSTAWPGWEDTGVTTQDLNRRSLRLQGARLMSAETGRNLFQNFLAKFQDGTVYILDGRSMGSVMIESASRMMTDRLLRPASRGHEIMSVPGLNQKEMPYLKDHLVQRACIFPGSGSLALMLYRAYLRTGKLGNVRNFQAMNFLVVPAESSNVTVRIKSEEKDRLNLQVFSHQLLAQCEIVFEETPPCPRVSAIQTDLRGVTDFDQTVSVYTGPNFLLSDLCFLNSGENLTLLELNLEKAPRYLESGFVDKFHRLLEFAFNSAHARAIQYYGILTVPKSFAEVRFHASKLKGSKFVSLIREMKEGHRLYQADVLILNEAGETAIEIKDLSSIAVGEKASRKSKGFKLYSEEKSFFKS